METMLRTGLVISLALGVHLGIHQAVQAQATEAEAPSAEAATAPQAVRQPVFRLMSASQDKLFRRMLPEVDDAEIQAILKDPRLLLYTEAEMPRAYQNSDANLSGVHNAHYNVSANGSEPYGNGNIEFPWGSPAGTHRTSNTKSFRFLWLPLDESGKVRPVVWYRRHLTGEGGTGYAWTYPVGAVLGEVLIQRGPDRRDYTFELRVRIREHADWGVNVFRPFPTAESLAERIRELRPEWSEDERLTTIVTSLEQPKALPSRTLQDFHPGQVFRQSMGVDTLPDLQDHALVAELLLTTPFSSALGEMWREGSNGVDSAAPTTLASFHVVPARYDAGFIRVDRQSCIRCHQTVNQHVNRFQAGRDWYGRIRGSDGIFSFHPFEPSCLSSNGYNNPVQLRGDLIRNGIVAQYTPSKHPAQIYHQVKHLKE